MTAITRSKRKINWFAIFRLLGIIVFIVILFKIDLSQTWKHLKTVKPVYFLVALVFQAIMLFLKGLRWNLITGRTMHSSGFLFTMGTFLESYAMGVVTPGRLGEAMKAGYETTRTGKWMSIYKIVSERGFDIGVFILLAGLALWVYKLLPVPSWVIMLIIVLGILVLTISFLLLSSGYFGKLIVSVVSVIIKKAGKQEFTNGILSATSALNILVLSLLSNTATFVSCFLLAKGIDIPAGFLYVSGTIAVSGLLNLVPVTVMGLGTRELTFLYFFKDFNTSLVLAFSFLVFLTLQAGGGLMALISGQYILYKQKRLQK